MRIATGTVVEGRVVVEGEPLREGAKVAIVTLEEAEGFDLSREEEVTLLQSIAEADRGELIELNDILSRLGDPH
jgi:hypothetical protein